MKTFLVLVTTSIPIEPWVKYLGKINLLSGLNNYTCILINWRLGKAPFPYYLYRIGTNVFNNNIRDYSLNDCFLYSSFFTARYLYKDVRGLGEAVKLRPSGRRYMDLL